MSAYLRNSGSNPQYFVNISLTSPIKLGQGNQLTSSAIVHPSPPWVVRFFLEQIGSEVKELNQNITAKMLQFPGPTTIAARNWLTLDTSAAGSGPTGGSKARPSR
jgi:hypothetical protein